MIVAEVAHHGRFECADGGERVAGTAVALIFDGRHADHLAPIDAARDRRSSSRSRGGWVSSSRWLENRTPQVRLSTK